jgi:hypothetical protein
VQTAEALECSQQAPSAPEAGFGKAAAGEFLPPAMVADDRMIPESVPRRPWYGYDLESRTNAGFLKKDPLCST